MRISDMFLDPTTPLARDADDDDRRSCHVRMSNRWSLLSVSRHRTSSRISRIWCVFFTFAACSKLVDSADIDVLRSPAVEWKDEEWEDAEVGSPSLLAPLLPRDDATFLW